MSDQPHPRASAGAGGEPSSTPLDWQDWHAAYDRPSTPLARRLALVQRHVEAALDQAPPGGLRAISVCAGQGHDILGVLAQHPRREDVAARLVELDPDNVREARRAASQAGLDRVEIVEGDASLIDSYAGAVPADLLLLCGVLGNISVADVQRTVQMLPQLCAADARLIWTRNRNPPDLLPQLLAMLADSGFEQLALDAEPTIAVGSAVLRAEPQPPQAGARMFRFIGQGALWPHLAPERRQAMQALFRADCSLVELVEALRAIPLGGAPDQSAEAMLREARGTPASKHLFLRELLQARFPGTRPQVLHRLYRLDPELASRLYGPAVAGAIPPKGLIDVHRFLTVELDGRRISLDVTAAGPAWDGRSPLAPPCGPGTDVPAEGDPDRALTALLAQRAGPEHAALERALAAAGLPDPQPHI